MKIQFKESSNKLENFNNLSRPLDNLMKILNYYSKEYGDFAVCLLDISNFKTYNYLFGYKFGNEVLNEVLNEVQVCVNDFGSAYSLRANILLIILYKENYKNKITAIVEKILELFNKKIEIDNQKLKISVNIGISLYPSDSKEVENVLKYAEIALNYSKDICKERYKFFQLEMHKNIIEKEKIKSDLQKAICNKEFILYYQPQVDVRTMSIYGAEALVRWNHPKYGIVSPQNFINVIEQNGMINEIGKFVFFEACRQLKEWNELGYNDLNISINISEKQMEDDNLLDFIDGVLKETGVKAKYINIEITERMFISFIDRNLKMLRALKKRGLRIFIDDFGIKYSSLSYLFLFPVDGIKIDKVFIDGIGESEKKSIITRNIVKLANELKLDVIAEGVEKIEQLEWLMTSNCYKIQGYIFEKAVSNEKFVNYLKNFKA
jgi:diguanylate cyclase (GGDEF)-like protein